MIFGRKIKELISILLLIIANSTFRRKSKNRRENRKRKIDKYKTIKSDIINEIILLF